MPASAKKTSSFVRFFFISISVNSFFYILQNLLYNKSV